MAIFSIEFYSFARFSQIPAAGAGGMGRGGGGWVCGLVTGSLRCLIERESYPAVLEGQKLLHKRCMDIKQNYILPSHASTLADMFVSNLF